MASLTLRIPKNVVDYFTRLDALMEQYPVSLPLEAAAEFLGMDPRNLRSAIHTGTSFGMGWKITSRWSYYINSAQFYMAATSAWARAGVFQAGEVTEC